MSDPNELKRELRKWFNAKKTDDLDVAQTDVLISSEGFASVLAPGHEVHYETLTTVEYAHFINDGGCNA